MNINNIIKEEINKLIKEADRHSSNYYKEYNEKRKKKVKLLIDIALDIMRNTKKNVVNVEKDLIDTVKIITTTTTKHILNV